jgi:hypothetical protein
MRIHIQTTYAGSQGGPLAIQDLLRAAFASTGGAL